MSPAAADVARRLEGRRSGNGRICRCPVPSHGCGRGDRNPSLMVSDDEDGGVRLHCFAGCDRRTVRAEIRALTGIDLENQPRRPATVATAATLSSRPCSETIKQRAPVATGLRPAATEQADNARRTAVARQLFREAVAAAGTPVERYLRETRGLALAPPPTLRFHPSLWHSDERRCYPAMVAAVQGADGSVVAINRTYLEGCRKAPVGRAKVKKALGPIAGGAVRLAPAADGMVIGEGIEDVLAVMMATGRPGWAALGAGNMPSLILPREVRDVTILVDNDSTGLNSARSAATRWCREGRKVRIAYPPAGFKDFAEILAGAAA